MTLKKPPLGRGLAELLGQSAAFARADAVTPDAQTPSGTTSGAAAPGSLDEQLARLPLDLLQPGRYQPRLDMRPETLAELADSIRSQGVVQPIVVRAIGEPDERGAQRYEIIAGERRWRAAQQAGLREIPAVIRRVDDEAAIAMALIENIQRENLNPLEEARALQRLIAEFGLTHQLAAEAVGRSRASVTNLLRLLELPDEVCERLVKRELEMGHARALLGLAARRAQIEVATLVVRKSLSVRETEALVRQMAQPGAGARAAGGSAPQAARELDPNIRRLQDDLSEKLGASVAIEHANGRGRLVVKYNSLDELDGILGHIV